MLVSCAMTGDGGLTLEEETRAKAMLIHSERNALIATENEAFQDLDAIAMPSGWAAYEGITPQLDAAIADYREELRLVLASASGELTDALFLVLDTVDLNPVEEYYEAGYSSLSDSLAQSQGDLVEGIYLSVLESGSERLDEAFSRLEREARIWAENQENLTSVGQGMLMEPITEPDDKQTAHEAMLAWFELLGQNEVVQRSQSQNGGQE